MLARKDRWASEFVMIMGIITVVLRDLSWYLSNDYYYHNWSHVIKSKKDELFEKFFTGYNIFFFLEELGIYNPKKITATNLL